jgi:hypothetical protein
MSGFSRRDLRVETGPCSFEAAVGLRADRRQAEGFGLGRREIRDAQPIGSCGGTERASNRHLGVERSAEISIRGNKSGDG